SFASTLNYAADDYIMSHLARRAVASGQTELIVDLLTGEAGPPALAGSPVEQGALRLLGSDARRPRQNPRGTLATMVAIFGVRRGIRHASQTEHLAKALDCDTEAPISRQMIAAL